MNTTPTPQQALAQSIQRVALAMALAAEYAAPRKPSTQQQQETPS